MNNEMFNGKLVFAHAGIPGMLRPFDIITDLRWLHGCLDDPRHDSNWILDRESRPLIQHYLRFHLAQDAQAFVYENEQRPVVQFDLLPLPGDPRLSSLPYPFDYVLHFRQPELRGGNTFLANGLNLVRTVFKQYQSQKQLFLPVPEGSFTVKKIALAAGFQYLEEQPAGLKVDIFIAE